MKYWCKKHKRSVSAKKASTKCLLHNAHTRCKHLVKKRACKKNLRDERI